LPLRFIALFVNERLRSEKFKPSDKSRR